MPVILWTDALVFILLASLSYIIVRLAKNPQDRARWSKAYTQPIRMIALVVLIFYVSIGFLDCLHYREQVSVGPAGDSIYSDQVHSILDWLMLPNSEQMETSYSAPFATELFSENMVKTADGDLVWVSTKLQYVTDARLMPLLLAGTIYALSTWLIVSAGLWYALRKSSLLQTNSRWHIAWFTFGIILWLVSVAAQLTPNYHIFGTDKVGGDVFYAAIKSIRTGLIIGTVTTFITMPFAIIFGTMAGYFRGWVDDLIQYLYTTLSSVPAVLLIAAAVLTLDAAMQRHDGLFTIMAQRTDMRLLMLCCVLGLTSWTSLCRIIRGETLKLRTQEYVLAARVLGLSRMVIIFKHIIPNLMHIIIISVVLDFSGLVLAEAVLSYIGVGVDPTTYSWGNMINSARMELGRDPVVWWNLVGAFCMMFTLVLAANIFADGVRDAFDSRAI